ncbi:Uncharacterised protein [Acinetobacter baumannii]|nr:Uncharacterised protein [Acinetobacter baumannii]
MPSAILFKIDLRSSCETCCQALDACLAALTAWFTCATDAFAQRAAVKPVAGLRISSSPCSPEQR